jgi:hypothetical protein
MFLASFLLFSCYTLRAGEIPISLDHSQAQFIQTANGALVNSIPQVSEKEETETESDYQLTAFLLPFFVSQLNLQIIETKYFVSDLQTFLPAKPIYLKVSNFRI